MQDEVETRSIFISFDTFDNNSYFSKYQKQIKSNVNSIFSLNGAMENDTQIRDLVNRQKTKNVKNDFCIIFRLQQFCYLGSLKLLQIPNL